MKSCPFCGSRADLNVISGYPATRTSAYHHASCSSCNVTTALFGSKKEAEAAWDNRSGLADANPLASWIDLNSGTIIHTESEDKKPRIHGFALFYPGEMREHYRLCNWKLLRDYFRTPK